MIGADRRGYIAGSDEARKYPHDMLPHDMVMEIAHCTFIVMQRSGYAHIEPEEKFLEGFLKGFEQHYSLSGNATLKPLQ